MLGKNPLRRLWLCVCILAGCLICLRRNLRVTFEIVTTDSKIIDSSALLNPTQSAANLRVPKPTMPLRYNFLFYNEESLHRERNLYRTAEEEILPAMQELLEKAEDALEAGPWSVTHKPSNSLAPSGSEHDYFHPATYFWPHKRKDGTIDKAAPYDYHDGERIPGTAFFEKGSDNFDRSRVASMQYNTTILGLAYFLSGNEDYAEVAVRNLRVWFLNPATKMNPHLLYSQVRRNHNKDNIGSQSGIIELKDLYFFLDAVQMVLDYLEENEVAQLKDWFSQYMEYLETSVQGMDERKTKNNHGLYFDIQQMAVANFLGDEKKLERIWRRAESRVSDQISDQDGSLRKELKHNTCEHYQMFTLEGWWTMARIGSNVLGQKLWITNKNALCRASEHAIPYLKKRTACPGNVQQENDQRWWPLVVDAVAHCPSLRSKELVWSDWMTTDSKNLPDNLYEMPRMYNPHDGIAPFWNLGLPVVQTATPGAWRIKPEETKQKSTSADKKAKSSGGSSENKGAADKKSSSSSDKKSSNSGGLLVTTKSKSSTSSTKSASSPKLSTVAVPVVDPSDEFIPAILRKAALKNPKYQDRINRIKKWKKIGQTKIARKMINKTLDELMGSG